MTRRARLLIHCDRLLAIVLVTLLVGTSLAFGGAVWWARPLVGALTFVFVVAWLVRVLLDGSWRVLKSPLTALGLLALVLAVVQLVPLPDGLAGWLSPGSRSLHALGVMPEKMPDPSADLPAPASTRSPMSVDRSATMRWLAGAAACLALFWSVGHYTDRLGRLYLVWGAVVAAFLLNTTIGVVQLIGDARGLYGGIEPGSGSALAPSLDDLSASPNSSVLRPASAVGAQATAHTPAWSVARPARPFLLGTLMGGPGAYLALGALGLPLGLALVMQLLAPRGSREDIWLRLRHSGRSGLVGLLCGLVAASALLVGLIAGPLLSVPFALGLLLVGLPVAWPSGLRWTAVALTAAAVGLLGIGVTLGGLWVDEPGTDPGLLADRAARASSLKVWADSVHILRDFPAFGSGMGSFSSIYPLYKTHDRAHTVAHSSVVQWAIEAGAAGVLLLVLGGAWCAWRLPMALRRVGSADGPLAFGLIGTAVCFALFSTLHWSVELAAVAVAACAVGGTCDRWLAGGTDLFVDRV